MGDLVEQHGHGRYHSETVVGNIGYSNGQAISEVMQEVTNEVHDGKRLVSDLLITSQFAFFVVCFSFLLGKGLLGSLLLGVALLSSSSGMDMGVAAMTVAMISMREVARHDLLNQEESHDTKNDDAVSYHLLGIMRMTMAPMRVVMSVCMIMMVVVVVMSAAFTQMGKGMEEHITKKSTDGERD